MESELIFKLILQYRYWILIPLSLVEGPVVAFFSGTLSSFGYFNLPLLAAIFFIRDITLDILYYILGFYASRASPAWPHGRTLHAYPCALG